MPISFREIFKNSDMLNPVTQQTLLLAGEYAEMGSGKLVIDLASGKGGPSLFWASEFGVQVDGYELDEINVAYANARATLLNLEGKARYFCRDLKDFIPERKYDIVAALGFDVSIFGGRPQTFDRFKSMVKSDGFVIFTEPVWVRKPVPPAILKALKINQEDFITVEETRLLVSQQGYREVWHAVSAKEDWEAYVRPIFVTVQEFAQTHPDCERDAQAVIEGFKAEYDAAGKDWDVVLWVLKSS